MNIKSKYAQDEEEIKEPCKQYMWLGYGFYNLTGLCIGRMDTGMVRNPKMFDPIFESLGWKKTERRRSEGME